MPTTKTANAPEKGNTPESFDFMDDVRYEDFIEDRLPEHIIFPEELNRFLRDQIRDLTTENGCLRRALEESDEKLRNLQKEGNVSAWKVPATAGRASEMAATKIVELSKKCREQTAEVEVLKSKCKDLEMKLASKEAEVQNEKFKGKEKSQKSNDSNNESEVLSVEDELKEKEEQIRILNDKLHQVNSKLYESKNTCTALRQEINKAQKLLSSEVGENVSIAGLSSHQSGWKGRSEQIQQLQQKVTDLQSRLSEFEGTSKGTSVMIEQRNITNLRNIEKERRQQVENAAKELRQATIALEASKRKQEAGRARVKVLENELNNAKQSILLLNEKRTHDDQLIQAINGQLKAVENKFQDRETELQNLRDKAENECIRVSNELNRIQTSHSQLVRKLEERETELDSLKAGSAKGQRCSFYSQGKPYDSPLSTARSNRDHNEYVTLGIAAEAERERLLELVTVLNRRIDEERCVADQLSDLIRAERNKSARLETKLQRLEMEKVGMSRINTRYQTRSKNLNAVSSSEDIGNEEFRFKMELLEEECLALKARLATVQRDKASDLVIYKQMLDQARKTFQDAYRGKPPTSGCHSTVTI